MKVKSQVKSLPVNRWLEAAQEARERLTALKRRAAKLRNSIRIFEQNAKTGEPWPGDSATN